MPSAEHTSRDKPTLLEVVLQVQGDFRSRLASIGATPLQAGVLLYLQRHAEPRLIEVAAAVGVQPPTVTRVIHNLVRKRWVTNRHSIEDLRVVCLRLTRQGQVIARRIKDHVHRCEREMGKGNVLRMGQRVAKGATH